MTAACRSKVRAFAVAFAVLGCIAGAAPGDEPKPVALPPAAQQAVMAEFPSAKISDVETRREGAFQLYVVELTAEKQNVEVTVSASGVILEIEVEIAQADVPKAAADAIADLAAGARVTCCGKSKTLAETGRRRIIKHDTPVISYTADLAKNEGEISLTAEVEVTAEGKVLQRPAWKKVETAAGETKSAATGT